MRLIDADALKKLYEGWIRQLETDSEYAGDKRGVESCLAVLEDAPTIDAVPVVRCKDCKHYENHRPKVLENCERNGHLIPMSPDDFCSYGERRSDD